MFAVFAVLAATAQTGTLHRGYVAPAVAAPVSYITPVVAKVPVAHSFSYETHSHTASTVVTKTLAASTEVAQVPVIYSAPVISKTPVLGPSLFAYGTVPFPMNIKAVHLVDKWKDGIGEMGTPSQ